jgi:hypothetical protein
VFSFSRGALEPLAHDLDGRHHAQVLVSEDVAVHHERASEILEALPDGDAAVRWDAAKDYERAWNGILLIANAPDAASLEIVEFVARGLWMDQIVKSVR